MEDSRGHSLRLNKVIFIAEILINGSGLKVTDVASD